MGINLSIKNAPEELVDRLRRRAQANHRSLQGELLAILESATSDSSGNGVQAVLEEIRRRNLKTPREAASMLRSDRKRR